MDETLLALLDELARFGTANDARETERPRRMLNITPATGRLLWILVRQARATRILEVGTSNAYSTIWLADAARETGGRVVTLEADPSKVALARENLGRAGLLDHVEILEGRAADTLARLPGPLRPRLPRRRSRQLRDLSRAGAAEAPCPAGSSSPTMSCRMPPSSRTTSDASSHIPRSSRSPSPSATGRRSPTSSRRRRPRRACRCSTRPRRGRRDGRGRARRPSGRCRSS